MEYTSLSGFLTIVAHNDVLRMRVDLLIHHAAYVCSTEVDADSSGGDATPQIDISLSDYLRAQTGPAKQYIAFPDTRANASVRTITVKAV